MSLFAFDRAVHDTLRGHATADLWNDATELRALLLRVAAGSIVAALLLMLAGHPLLGAYIPLAFAVVINVCRIASLRVDALALLAACIAIAGLAPIAAWRTRAALVVAALFALLPFVAVSLASSALSGMLAVPARTFAIAALASLVAAAILPPIAPRTRARGKLERRLLRASASIALAAVALTIFLLSWFGDRLDPRHAERIPERSHIYLRVAMPVGTPLAPTLAALANAERALAHIDGIRRFWGYAGPGRAMIIADVAPCRLPAARSASTKRWIAQRQAATISKSAPSPTRAARATACCSRAPTRTPCAAPSNR